MATFLAAPLASLYDGPTNVVQFRDFTQFSGSRSAFAVEFFAGWCGHCRSFAPTWKEVAKRTCALTSGGRPLLVIGAVDCVADFLLCNEVGIESFPTFKMFGESFPPSGLPLQRCAHGCKSVVETTVALLEAAPRGVLEAAVAAAGGSSSGAEVVEAVTSLSSRPS